MSGLRPIAAPFVAAAPAGARVRTRLRVSSLDETVLWTAGSHLGSLAGRDLAARCAGGRLEAEGPGSVPGGAEAGADGGVVIAVGRGDHAHERGPGAGWPGRTCARQKASLQARIRRVRARLAIPAGGKDGRVRGYATPAERHAKALRLQVLQARLARVDRQLGTGTVPVVRGGRALLRQRGLPRHRGPDRGAVAGGSGKRPACS